MLKCWGENDHGQLGLGDLVTRGDMPGQMSDALPAVDLGTGRMAVAVAVDDIDACGLLDDGTVKCWGDNGFGQLGLGDTTNRGDMSGEMGDALPAVDLGSGRRAVAITAGTTHTCALFDDGAVKCWGLNPSGELGLGDALERGDAADDLGNALPAINMGSGRRAVAIAAGGDHTCALLDNGSVKCWGSDFYGQLGLGDTANRGDMPGQMGDALPRVDLGPRRTAVAIAAGTVHTCALLHDGSVKCWGDNEYGELGLGDTVTRGNRPFQMGDALPPVDLGAGRTAVAITAGADSTCALLDNGTVKCWGGNLYGELGLGDRRNRGRMPGEMGDALPAVDLGTGRRALAVWTGADAVHTCALLDNDTVKCWGGNQFGQLGLGDTNNRGDNPGEMGDALPAVDLGH